MASAAAPTPAPAPAPAGAAPATSAAPTSKPVKPDDEAFKKEVARLEEAHKIALESYRAIKAKVEAGAPDKSKENPAQKRRQELLAQLGDIRNKQGASKLARTAKMEQVKRLDEQLRVRMAEQKTARAKVPFKSVDEVDQRIAQLEAEVNKGTMKLVDEKKALAEASNMRKLRKNFAHFGDMQKAIDELKARIKTVKDALEDPEAKALSDQYTKTQAELDALKAEQDQAYKGLASLRKERDQLRAKQQEAFLAVRKYKDDYHAQRKAHQAWVKAQHEQRRQREQAERERIAKERKMERAQKMLAEASDPAYMEEMRRANSLLHFFDPGHVAEKGPLLASKGLAAAPQRKVDGSGIVGVRLVSKKDRDDEYLPAKKGGKKGKKNHGAAAAAEAAAAPASSKFSCPPAVIEDCAFVGVEPPMSAAEVPAVMDKIKAKLEHWKADQPEQTRKNIEKAKKEIERLEAEEAAAATNATAIIATAAADKSPASPASPAPDSRPASRASSPSPPAAGAASSRTPSSATTPSGAVNGGGGGGGKTFAEVAKKMEKVSLEDKEKETVNEEEKKEEAVKQEEGVAAAGAEA